MKLIENVETYLQKKRAERSETIRKRNQEPNRKKEQTGLHKKWTAIFFAVHLYYLVIIG